MILTGIGMLKNASVLSLTGTMKFNGTNSTLTYLKDNDMMPNGDFTIEWFQYQTDVNNWPRVFAIGSTTAADVHLAVSLEGGVFYFWHKDSATAISFGSIGSYKNQWVHFAIARSGSSLKIFKNGTQLGTTLTNNTNFNSPSTNLVIGNEGANQTSNAAFGGWISNFRWVKGTAVYTSNFTAPIAPLDATPSATKLLLLANSNATVTTDSSASNRAVVVNNVTWQSFSNTMV
jgi:hypothetical protein